MSGPWPFPSTGSAIPSGVREQGPLIQIRLSMLVKV
jgi:hypothetical protein